MKEMINDHYAKYEHNWNTNKLFVWCDLPGEGIVFRKTVVGD